MCLPKWDNNSLDKSSILSTLCNFKEKTIINVLKIEFLIFKRGKTIKIYSYFCEIIKFMIYDLFVPLCRFPPHAFASQTLWQTHCRDSHTFDINFSKKTKLDKYYEQFFVH